MEQYPIAWTNAVELGISVLDSESASFVLIIGGSIIHKAFGHGIRPILELQERQPELFAGAVAVDKIVGKASALLLVKSGVKLVYGQVMSDAAFECLTGCGVPAGYGIRVGRIVNRDGSGICPLERAVKDTDDPEAARLILQETIKQLSGHLF